MTPAPATAAAPVAVRRPRAEISFGAAAADWAAALESVTVELGVAPAVDSVELRVAPIAGKPAPAVGDSGTVALGFDDGGAKVVFTGRVELVARDVAGGMRIVAVGAAAAVARLRLNRSFEGRTAGDVVRDLVSAAGAKAGTVSADAKLAFFAVDDRRGAWRQIADLARDCGCLAYVTPAGEVTVVAPPSGAAVATFAYATDVFELSAGPRTAATGAVTVVGEGAAGGKGASAWSWLVKDPASVRAAAGTGAPERLRSAPGLRSRDAAQSAAKSAAAGAAAGATTGRLLVGGAPAVTVGSVFAISGAPNAALNGNFAVHGVRHRLARGGGFTTLIGFAGAPARGGAAAKSGESRPRGGS